MYKIILITFSVIVTTTLTVFSQSLIVSISNDKYGVPYDWGSAIALFDAKTNEFRVVYKNNDLVFYVTRLKAAPSGLFIGAIGHERDRKGKPDEKSSLIIIDTNGNIVSIIDDAVLFDWAPSGDKIVFGTGIFWTDAGYPKAKRLWIYDIKSTNNEDIGVASAWNLAWAKFDSLIYIAEKGCIYKIDYRDHSKLKTPYRDLYFSPDGKYYYKANREGGGFYLYETMSNRDITPPYINKEENRVNHWISKNELVVGDGINDNKIINLATGKVKKTFSGRMIDYDAKTAELIVYKDKKVFMELVSSKVEKIKIVE